MPSKIEKTNTGYIQKYGDKVASQVKSYARIRSWGDKNSAITFDNEKVERQEFIFCESYGMVRCLPTNLHFVYEDKSKKIGRWLYMCTCGSLSGIIAYDELKDFITTEPTGYLLACIAGVTAKQNTGIFRHADNSTE